MELQNNNGFMKSSEEFKKSEFTIKNSAKAFSILSSGLYSNKIRAIVRELSCNAIDAQRDAGKPADCKFELHLPTQSEPTFMIRDFGTGISPENIERVYTTYFESTKTQSNDMIGCLGLGSKTPFCYTDNFMIRSFYGGKCYSYNACLNEDGLPVISFIMEQPTTEDNGLEVEFAVRTFDIEVFRREAEFVGSFLSVKPKVNITVEFDVLEKMKKKTFAAADGSYYFIQAPEWNASTVQREMNKSYVIMGNVPYTLNAGNITGISSLEIEMINAGIHIIVPIGAVEPQASREALSYTKSTVAFLKTRLAEIVSDVRKELEATIANFPNLWAACVWARTASKDAKNIPFVRKLVEVMKFNGKSVFDDFGANHQVFRKESYYTRKNGTRFRVKDIRESWITTSREGISPESTLFVTYKSVENSKKGWDDGARKLKCWMLSSYAKQTLVRVVGDEVINHYGLIDGVDVFNLENLPDFIAATTVPRAPRASGYEGKKKTEVWWAQARSNGYFPAEWDKVTVDFDCDLEEKIYCLKTKDWNSSHEEDRRNRSASFWWAWKGEGLVLNALTPSQIEEIEGNDTWIKLEDWTRREVKKFLDSESESIHTEVLRQQVVSARYSMCLSENQRLFTKKMLEIHPNHEFSRMMNFFFPEVIINAPKPKFDAVNVLRKIVQHNAYTGFVEFRDATDFLRNAEQEIQDRVREVFSRSFNEGELNFWNEFERIQLKYPIIQILFSTKTLSEEASIYLAQSHV